MAPSAKLAFRAAIDSCLPAALTARGFAVEVVDDAAAARNAVLASLPLGALVAHGGSETLRQIGLVDALAASTRVRYGNAEWLAIDDADDRFEIRRRNSVFADAYLGSVQAIACTGQVVAADYGGSRVGPYLWGPKRVIWVVGANKVVPDLDAALRRVSEVAFPLEDARIRISGGDGSAVNKVIIYDREPVPGRTTLILVREALGF